MGNGAERAVLAGHAQMRRAAPAVQLRHHDAAGRNLDDALRGLSLRRVRVGRRGAEPQKTWRHSGIGRRCDPDLEAGRSTSPQRRQLRDQGAPEPDPAIAPGNGHGNHQRDQKRAPQRPKVAPRQAWTRRIQLEGAHSRQHAPAVGRPERLGCRIALTRPQCILDQGQRPVLQGARLLKAPLRRVYGRPIDVGDSALESPAQGRDERGEYEPVQPSGQQRQHVEQRHQKE